MLRITIELLPRGDEKRARHLGTAKILNDGTGTETSGNYRVILSKWGRPDENWLVGQLKSFPRKRLGPWDLLFRALAATVGNRNVRRFKDG